MWCIPPKANAEFVAAMEDVLEVYERPFDPARPLIALDEAAKQLLADVRPPLPMRPGDPERVDYEYRREGTGQPAYLSGGALHALGPAAGTAPRLRA